MRRGDKFGNRYRTPASGRMLADMETDSTPFTHLLTSRRDYARRIGVSLRQLDYLVADGIIPVVRLGRRCVRIPVEQADAAILKNSTGKGVH